MLEFFRRLYYRLLASVAPDEHIIPRFTGFGLYDRAFLDALGKFHDPYPYFRGLVSEAKKVVWPDRKTVVRNTLVTIAVCAILGLLIWLVDIGLSKLIQLVLSL